MADDLNEQELVRAARRGSAEAAGRLFDLHWAECRRIAYSVCGRRALAEDAAQDALVTAVRRLHQLDGPVGPWLRRIVVNRTLTLMRTDRREVPLEGAPDAGAWDEVEVPDPALRDAVRSLAPDRRDAIVLRYWLDMSPPEIAEALGLRTGTVNSRLSRGLADLKAHLEVSDAGRR